MQRVFSKWLWEIGDAKAAMDEIIAEGYTIDQFQIVPDITQDDFYLIVVATKTLTDVMDTIGDRAQARGITQELVDSYLEEQYE